MATVVTGWIGRLMSRESETGLAIAAEVGSPPSNTWPRTGDQGHVAENPWLLVRSRLDRVVRIGKRS
jgi:hypothetical protein